MPRDINSNRRLRQSVTLDRVFGYSRPPCKCALALNRLLTPALLRFDPLRNDPRFQKLAQSEAPK